ncbi:periplasmic binding protein [Thraustotheca clavata]|uniref:Periplasmic binding protein n=1 Tax=Thraustotheca clavata TaxID=74557 RepID=A0A1V9YYL3_9STRA|nr:periplasmic binding protein [Thraustotheca clavata]
MANGMWTRMAASGTSVIIAPKVVSAELEAKIKECIEGFMQKNKSHAESRSLKIVRQHVEKTLSLSLTHHKDLLKRLMHNVLQRSSMATDVNSLAKEPLWKPNERTIAIMNGLNNLYQYSRSPEVFSKCSFDAVQHLYELAEITADREMHRTILLYARQLASQFLDNSYAFIPEWLYGAQPTPLQVLDVISQAYTLSCIHMQHPRLKELRVFLATQQVPYTAMDYFGWDPNTAYATTDSKQTCYQKIANALTMTWYANHLEIMLGCTYGTVFKWIPSLYPYAAPSELTDKEYLDQCYLISRLVLTLTNFGSLQLTVDLLPHEYHFMQQHFDTHLARSDLHIVGSFARALKGYLPKPTAVLERAMAFVLCSQSEDGSWQQLESETPEELVHKSAVALFTLCDPCFNGYAPSVADVNILPVLERLAATEHERRGANGDNFESDLKRNNMKANVQAVLTKAAICDAAIAPVAEANELTRIQGILEATTDIKAMDAFVALDILTSLKSMQLTVETLKATGLGRSINKLRKHPSEHVSNLSQALVMKIASFLPAATTICYELGIGHLLSCVTFECQFPKAAKDKPKVIRCVFDADDHSSSKIEEFVSTSATNGTPLYAIDESLLRDVDVVLIQDLCEVCAIGPANVLPVLKKLNIKPKIVQLTARGLSGLYRDINAIASVCGIQERGNQLVESLQKRVENVTTALHGCKPIKTVCVEWLDPIYNAGHWMPELVKLAGGYDPLAAPETFSVAIDWTTVAQAGAEALVIMPCGFNLERSIKDSRALLPSRKGFCDIPAVQSGRVYFFDANRLFSGASPALVDGLEVLAHLLHPDRFAAIASHRKDYAQFEFDGAMDKRLAATTAAATAVLEEIPLHMDRIQELLQREFPPTTPSQVHAAFSPLVSIDAATNERMVRLVHVVLDEIHTAIQKLQCIERWIQLLVPKIADGNNFGVEVQKSVQLQISASRTALQKAWDGMTDYYWQRATAHEKFAIKASTEKSNTVTSTAEEGGKDGNTNTKSTVAIEKASNTVGAPLADLIAYVIAVDVKWYYNLQRTLESVGDHYAFSLDAIEKNSSKIKLPRGHGERVQEKMNGNPVSLQWKYPPDLVFNEESLLDIILTLRMKIEVLEKSEMGNGEIPAWLSDAMQNIANNSEAMVECQNLKDQFKYMKQTIDGIQKDIVLLRRDIAAARTIKKRNRVEDEGKSDTPVRRRPSIAMALDRAPSRRESLIQADLQRKAIEEKKQKGAATGERPTTPQTKPNEPVFIASEAAIDHGVSQEALEMIIEPLLVTQEQQKAEFAVIRENSQEAKSSVIRLQAEMKRRDALIQARNSKHEGNVKILLDKLTHDLRACVTQNELIGFEQKSLILLKQESNKLSDEFGGLFNRTQEEIHMVRSMQEDINSNQAESLQKTQNRVEIMSDKIEEIIKTQDKFAKMLDELRRNSQAEHQHIQTIITQQGVMKEKLQALSEKQGKSEQFMADLAQAVENQAQSKQKSEDQLKEIIEMRSGALHNEIKRLDDIFEACSISTLSMDVKKSTERIEFLEHSAVENKKKITDLSQHVADTEIIYNTNFTNIYGGIERVSREASDNLKKATNQLSTKIKEAQEVNVSLTKTVLEHKDESEKNFATTRSKIENHQLETEGMKVHTEAAIAAIKEKLSYLEESNMSFRTEYNATQSEVDRTFAEIATETNSTHVILDSMNATFQTLTSKQEYFDQQLNVVQNEYRTEISATAAKLNETVAKEGERTEALYAAFTEKQSKFADMVAKASTRNMSIATLNKELDILCDSFVGECWKFEISSRQEGKIANSPASRADNNSNRKQFSDRQQNFLVKNAQFFADLVCAKAEYEVLKTASNKETRSQAELDAKMVYLQEEIIDKLNTRMLAKLANLLNGALARRTLAGGGGGPQEDGRQSGDGSFLETMRLQGRPSSQASARPTSSADSNSPFNKRRESYSCFGVRADSPVQDADARRIIQSPHSNSPYVYRGGFRIPNRNATINAVSDAYREMHHDNDANTEEFVEEDAGILGQTETSLMSSSVSLPAL